MKSFIISLFFLSVFLFVSNVSAQVPYDYLYEKFYGTSVGDYPIDNPYSLSHNQFKYRHLHRSPHRGGHSLYRYGHDYNRSTRRDGQGYHYNVYHYNPYTGCMQFGGFDYYNRHEYWDKYNY